MKPNMFLRKISFIWLLFNVSVIPLPLYKINLENEKVFEISSDSKAYDEENENEMIQPADLAELKFDIEDESRYKALHSYVDNYNKRKIVNKMQYINELTNLKPHIWESSNIEEDKPFVAGFKEDLDKVLSKIKDQDIYKRVHRAKHNNEQYDSPFLKTKLDNETTTIAEGDLIENIEPGEEIYDYEKFKKEYEDQIVDDISSNNTTFNATEEKLEEPEEIIKKLFSYENCTEVSNKLGMKAIDCLIYNYEHEIGKPAVKRTVSKIWLIIKVWFFIYICFAIPCWCQRGWCCCCFRCKACFPRRRILFAKEYYATNPPGILSKPVKKNEEKQFIKYEATLFEEDAYQIFEAAIRNI